MENEEVLNQESGISFANLLFLIKKNIVMIFAITFVFILCGGIYAFGFKKTVYTAKTSIIVMATPESSTTEYNAAQLSSFLINTVQDFIKADPVVKETSEETGCSEAKIIKGLSISSKANNLIITINYKSTSKEEAIAVVNSITRNVQIVVDSTREDDPTAYKYYIFANKIVPINFANDAVGSRGAAMILVISALLGAIVSFAIVLIKYLMDDTYTSKEDFEKEFKINVLALIERIEDEEGGK